MSDIDGFHFNRTVYQPMERGPVMIKIMHFVIAVAFISLASAGVIHASQTEAVCPTHGRECLANNGEYYCAWYENVRTNTLVRGRVGQLEYVLLPAAKLKTQRCVVMDHQSIN